MVSITSPGSCRATSRGRTESRKAAADREVPRDRPRFQEGLQLPERRVVRIVFPQCVQLEDELTRGAVGPQAQVHPVGVSLGGVGGEVRAQRPP